MSVDAAPDDIGTEDVTLHEFVETSIKLFLVDVHTALPCQVDTFDASKQTVSVVPGVNRYVPDGAGNWISTKLPKLSDVPVAMLNGGGFMISFPVKKGDEGLLIFCSRNISAWRATGNQGDPGDVGTHNLDGAVFLPALRSDARALKNASADNMMVGSDTNHASRFVITPNDIRAGANAVNFVALANKVQDLFDAWKAWGAALSLPVVGGGGGTAGPPSTPPPDTTNLASSNLKAEG